MSFPVISMNGAAAPSAPEVPILPSNLQQLESKNISKAFINADITVSFTFYSYLHRTL